MLLRDLKLASVIGWLLSAMLAVVAIGMASGDVALAAEPTAKPIKSLKRLDDTIHRFGGYGDNWHMSWADNDKVYVSLCDGTFLPGAEGPKVPSEYNSRMYAITGDAPDLKFEFLPKYPNLLNEGGRNWSRYYNFGTLALDGKLYQFLSTPNHPFNEPHAEIRGGEVDLLAGQRGDVAESGWVVARGLGEVGGSHEEEHGVLRGAGRHVFADHRAADGAELFAEQRWLRLPLRAERQRRRNDERVGAMSCAEGSCFGSGGIRVLCRGGCGRRGEVVWSDGGSGGGSHISQGLRQHEFASLRVAAECGLLCAGRAVFNDELGDGINQAWRVVWQAELLRLLDGAAAMGAVEAGLRRSRWTPGGDQAARCYQPQIAPKWISEDGKKFWFVWTDYQGELKYYAYNAQQIEVEFEK